MPATTPERTESEVRAKLSALLFCMTCLGLMGCSGARYEAEEGVEEEAPGTAADGRWPPEKDGEAAEADMVPGVRGGDTIQ